MGISLYRRYRPQKFSEVTGQSAAVDVLTKSLERSLVGHAYLFSGPRGCGKTTAARLLAKALDCLSPLGCEPCCECKNCLAIAAGESLDVVEIDGASNNGVDEVRELKTHVSLAPFSSRYKVYIIDEVHMLSIAAFNALLKTLEEPPAHVVFILATTEAHKVPVTIRSRCQHIPFHRIGTLEIRDRLTLVCSAEGITSAADALWEIARQADGALRDALSMLEQISGLGKAEITLSDVETTLGQASRSRVERWFSGWREVGPETLAELDKLLAGGASPLRFVEELFSLIRNLWLAARWKDALDAINASEQEKEYLRKEAQLWKPAELESIMRFLAELMPQARMGMRIDVLSGLIMTKAASWKGGAKSAPSFEASAEPARVFAAGTKPAALSVLPAPPVLPVSPASLFKASQEPLSENGWKPYSEEKWSDALRELKGKEFLLYCALLDASPFEDEERGGALILDVSERYCYEVLRLDRHRQSLKNILTPLHDAPEVVLRCGERWTLCDAASSQTETAKKRNPGKMAAIKEPYVEKFSPPPPESESDVPFAGLVREVTRWLGGELIMVRSGEKDSYDEGAMDENPSEG